MTQSPPTELQAELTAELVTSTWHPSDVRLSPDGRRVAWSATPYGQSDEHGESALWVAATDGSEAARRWTYGGNDTSPRWSPDGTRLAFLSDRKERGRAGLYVLDVEGGEAEAVVVRKSAVEGCCWAPDGVRLAFWAPEEPDSDDKRRKDERDDPDVFGERWPYARLHVVDLASGATTTLVDTDLHVIEAAWSPDGSCVAFVAQDTPDPDETGRQSVWVIDSGGEVARRLVGGLRCSDLAWTADGSHLVYVAPHEEEPQSSSTVWSIGLADGTMPTVIGTRVAERACSAGVRTCAEGVAIEVVEGLGTRLEWSDPATGERAPLWTASGDVFAYDVTADSIAALLAADAGPFEIWAGPAEHLRQLSDHHAAWAGVAMGAVEDFAFAATDGLALDGILIRPASGSVETDGPNATVVLVHGGPYWRSGRDLHCSPLDWGQWLAMAGYTVLMPNYRGGMGHGNAFATAVRADMGGTEWGDIVAAVDAAVERGLADPDRLGIGGWSQGGFLTAWAVTQTDRFAAAVMGAGVSDWGAMAALSDLPTFETALGGDRPWDGPGPHPAAERSPISYAAHRSTPLLILHGQEDVRVPVGQATSFHRALRGQDSPVELVTYPREPHGVAERNHQVDLLRRVREWYDRWLR